MIWVTLGLEEREREREEWGTVGRGGAGCSCSWKEAGVLPKQLHQGPRLAVAVSQQAAPGSLEPWSSSLLAVGANMQEAGLGLCRSQDSPGPCCSCLCSIPTFCYEQLFPPSPLPILPYSSLLPCSKTAELPTLFSGACFFSFPSMPTIFCRA